MIIYESRKKIVIYNFLINLEYISIFLIIERSELNYIGQIAEFNKKWTNHKNKYCLMRINKLDWYD